MAEAFYEPTPATDGATMNPVPGAAFQVFELADTTFSTPLSLRVGSGNPTTTVTASEGLATLPGVYVTSPNFEHIWKSGSFEWRRDSIDGAKRAVEDAKVSASNSAGSASTAANEAATSAQAARDAANLVDAPADTVMATVAANSGSEFATQQRATIAEEFVSNSHSMDLRKWYGALANRYAAPASVLVIGDSNSEGTGSTSVHRRWQSILQSELRGRFQPAGVVGANIPYRTTSPRLNPVPADYGVATEGAPGGASFGLGLRALTIGGTQSVTFTFTGTRAKLLGTKSNSSGRYNISLDGAVGSVVDGWSSALTYGNQIWDSGTLTAGTHTVKVTRDPGTTASPGNIYPEGLLTFNGDHDAGIRVIDAARHGSTLATFTGSGAWAPAIGRLGSVGLLIMPWGANDSTLGTPAANFRAGLDAIISQARGAGFAGSILLVEMPKRGNATEEVWSAYRAEIEAVAAGDPDIAVFDLRRRMPDYGTAEANALGLYSDEVHYADKGQGWIADQIASAITPR